MIRRELPASARRRTVLAATALAVVLAAAAGITVDAAEAGAANPSISVSPSTGLHGGQVVNVTGSGFGRNAQVYIVECAAGASRESQCSFNFSDLSTVSVANADGSGNLSAPSPTLQTSFKGIDCTKSACEIAAHVGISTTLTAGNTATHGISFASSGSGQGNGSHPSSPAAGQSSAPGTQPSGAGSASGASSAASSAGSSSAGPGSSSGSTVALTAGSSTAAGTSSPGAPQSSGTSPSGAAGTITTKADNSGRYFAVAIVALLGVLFVVAMAADGKRRRPGA